MKNETMNLRPGLIFKREGQPIRLTALDVDLYYTNPPKKNFTPIRLNHYVLKAFGFNKFRTELGRKDYYYKWGILIAKKPMRKTYHCCNLIAEKKFRYLHELQDFLESNSNLYPGAQNAEYGFFKDYYQHDSDISNDDWHPEEIAVEEL